MTLQHTGSQGLRILGVCVFAWSLQSASGVVHSSHSFPTASAYGYQVAFHPYKAFVSRPALRPAGCLHPAASNAAFQWETQSKGWQKKQEPWHSAKALFLCLCNLNCQEIL